MKARSDRWWMGALVGAVAVAACGQTSRRPDEAHGVSGSGGSFTLPMGGDGIVGEAGRAVGGSGNQGAAGGSGGRAVGGDESPGGAPHGEGGEVSGVGGEPPLQDCPDPLVFADPVVEAAVLERAGFASGPVTRAMAEEVADLSLHDPRTTALDGVGCLPNLQVLSITFGQISSLSALRDLRRLKRLTLWEVPVTSFAGLERSPLEQVYAHHTQIADLSALAGKRLQFLTLHDCRAHDLAPLAASTSLTNLTAAYCGVADLTPLASLTGLQVLDVQHNALTDLTPLAGLTELESLSVADNEVEDLSPLASLQKLATLHIQDNRVVDLRPLSQLQNLDRLEAANNLITSLAPLAVRFHGVADLTWNRIEDLSPLLQFKFPQRTGLQLAQQRDEDLNLLLDCAAQAETLALAKAMGFASLVTDCP